MSKEQLCWTCKNCSPLKCSWIKDFTPVKDWVAQDSRIKNGRNSYVNSYRIDWCPNYIEDGLSKKQKAKKSEIEKTCKELNISIRTYYRRLTSRNKSNYKGD